MIALIQFTAGAALVTWASMNCTRLDVATGRRDGGALNDDYGSNRGWYWPWSYLNIVGALLALASPITHALI